MSSPYYKTKPVITIDIDDVLTATNRAAETIAKQFNEKPDFSTYECFEGLSPMCAFAIMQLFFTPELCNPKTVKLTSQWVPTYLTELRKLFNVYFITARDNSLFEPTLRYFAHNKITINPDNLITTGSRAAKFEIMNRLKTVFHIDDSEKVIIKCMEHKLPYCMISNKYTGYNHHLRDAAGENLAKNIDEFWQRRNFFFSKINTK
jgi:uncharacterized HAD superfamily protein